MQKAEAYLGKTTKNNNKSNSQNSASLSKNSGMESAPVWRKRWFQICLGAIVILTLAALVLPPLGWFIYQTRSVLLPILIALVLAYAVNPLVIRLRQYGVPRPLSAAALIVLVLLAIALLTMYVLPLVIEQTGDLVSRIPAYWHQFLTWADINPQELLSKAQSTFHIKSTSVATSQPTTSTTNGANIDWKTIASAILAGLDIGYKMISSVIGLLGYFLLAAAILLFCFFFFVWKLDRILAWFVPFIPQSKRAEVLRIAHEMDMSVSGFIHGRLLQALGVATVLSIGWAIVGVPYWIILGISAGILNLVPYAAIIAWPLAVGLTWLDAVTGTGAGGFSFLGVIVAPTIVYLIGQGLDSWVVEPLVQGKATDLDPLTVLIVVLIGGSLAGLLGMIIAIPLAACIKIFAREIALPKLRKFSESIY